MGFFSVDENGAFVFINATLARWLGEDIHTILTEGTLHTYFDNVPDNARPFDIVPNGGAKQMAEVVMKGPAGKTFTASISQAVVNEGNGIVRTRGVVHDLTAETEELNDCQHHDQREEDGIVHVPVAEDAYLEDRVALGTGRESPEQLGS